MKFLFNIFLLIFSVSIALSAQDSSQYTRERLKGRFGEAVRLPGHFFRLAVLKIKAYEFEEISYGVHKRQYMLVCRPQDSTWKTNDVIFFFHGGGWRTGSPEQNRFLAAMLASYGYTVVMPAYRLSPKFCYEDMQADIDSAIIHGIKICDISPGSNKKIIIGGTSAGGHLAALLAYDNDRLLNLGIEPHLLKGYFSIASPLDLDLMPKSKLVSTYAGEPESVTFQLANPKHLIDERDRFPALFLHGMQDGIVDYRGTLAFVDLLECKGICPSLKLLTEQTHLETTTRWYYKEKADIGQGEMLLIWLMGLE
jgi:acetyl esterase/lipase